MLIKNGVFVGKSYCNHNLFILNVSENNKASSSSTYIVDSGDV